MRIRLWKTLIAGLGMVILLASSHVFAQQGGKRMLPAGPGKQTPPQQMPASDTGPQHRDAHLEGRMTPEQRQQLRRDVHSHGRDIYHRQRPGAKQP